jgi:hypothetical protein
MHKPNEDQARDKLKKRGVSAIKTIVLISGVFLFVNIPLALLRVILLSCVSNFDLETGRYPALTVSVRSCTIVMGTITPYLNPMLYLCTRKNIQKSLMILMPCLRRLHLLRERRVDIAGAVAIPYDLKDQCK